MSLTDLKHTLRKYEFPNCAKEALIRIGNLTFMVTKNTLNWWLGGLNLVVLILFSSLEQLLVGRGAPSSKQLDVAMDIIAEFVFCETDRRGTRRTVALTPLQELQLIDVMCEYLGSCANEITKNTVFLSMFGGVEGLRRLKILSILASMGVSASSTPVLLAVGVWLQQMGCSSSQSLQLVENIIRDHFFLNTSNQASLRSLATTAPQFVANFITAVTELYMQDGPGGRKMPPKNLLELNPAALPSGAIPMAAVTPLAGLIHWCALAPLYVDEEEVTTPLKRIKIEHDSERTIKQVAHRRLSEWELYTKLQLGVLSSLRAGRAARGAGGVLSAQLASALAVRVHAHAQAVLQRVALANGCIYGNITSLLASLDSLPENRLLKIIIGTHQTM
ncbi:Uncharacterized protein OBRU01_16769 [Operophtera brumata]|uniref:Uncharacterized protein n=1 Tax=Operophtera brumata TaxID=104452 RepID=A0A0L7L2I0_OPEBR|nr:Uncharacterized protein OBRU01_16769 [Operophtera brumata]